MVKYNTDRKVYIRGPNKCQTFYMSAIKTKERERERTLYKENFISEKIKVYGLL